MDMKTVATFLTPAAAEVARLALEQEGIPSYLEAAEYVAMVWIDATAVRWIKLQVAEDDEELALEILEKDVGASTAVPLRCCSACKAESPGNFEVCWSCGAPLTDEANVSELPAEAIDADIPEKPAGDVAVRRAFAVAIVGLVYLPLFAQIYSLWLLQKAAWKEQPMSPKWQKVFWLTGVLDIAVLFCAAKIFFHCFEFLTYLGPATLFFCIIVLVLLYLGRLVYQAQNGRGTP